MVRLNQGRGNIDYTVEFAMLDPVVKHFELNMLYWLRKVQSRPVTKPLSALRLSEGRRLRHNASAVRLTACHRKITRQKQLPLLFYMLVPKVYMSARDLDAGAICHNTIHFFFMHVDFSDIWWVPGWNLFLQKKIGSRYDMIITCRIRVIIETFFLFLSWKLKSGGPPTLSVSIFVGQMSWTVYYAFGVEPSCHGAAPCPCVKDVMWDDCLWWTVPEDRQASNSKILFSPSVHISAV